MVSAARTLGHGGAGVERRPSGHRDAFQSSVASHWSARSARWRGLQGQGSASARHAQTASHTIGAMAGDLGSEARGTHSGSCSQPGSGAVKPPSPVVRCAGVERGRRRHAQRQADRRKGCRRQARNAKGISEAVQSAIEQREELTTVQRLLNASPQGTAWGEASPHCETRASPPLPSMMCSPSGGSAATPVARYRPSVRASVPFAAKPRSRRYRTR
jgi:hypothetical protein